ncbi:hypothetical protein [Helicobacter bilis]|uniref:Uncharacterized protein n=1 Tax=Helicobacter bilis TaxID=37372 RepID=A0A4U8U730_9HELI|nr:hypothetical protein [Helicobacter bilis]MCI7411976.1 hypothetical protein [Helicobacter bilis]MDD7296426.1 hypothetical protein [Helicobacter bilis]MDY4399065.1 hypothetical protein [Helicobacter bilis]TLE07810.1 hypothetical protein LS78_007610 [Helicobacter bilis]TLE09534.1 hypothetical protein LS79_007805 [Helicobacter bilis]
MTKTIAIEELQRFDNVRFNEDNARGLIDEMSSGLKLPESMKAEFDRKMVTLFQQTKIIAGKLINIGRIVFAKIYQFIQDNPNLTLGTIIGAVFGSFLGMMPLIGDVLSLISPFLGAAIGGYIDYVNKGGRELDSTLQQVIAGATHTTKEFFKLLVEIFKALRNDF